MSSHPSGERTPAAALDHVHETKALARDPESWETADLDRLKDLALLECLRYGCTGREAEAATLEALYPVLLDRTSPADRLEIEIQVARRIEAGEISAVALIPFIFTDPSFHVVSSAALDLAVLFPPEDGDVLTGPKYLRDRFLESEYADTRVGIFAGLLARRQAGGTHP